jgi:hypothetical protein
MKDFTSFNKEETLVIRKILKKLSLLTEELNNARFENRVADASVSVDALELTTIVSGYFDIN